jgi:hypothetical protein
MTGSRLISSSAALQERTFETRYRLIFLSR